MDCTGPCCCRYSHCPSSFCHCDCCGHATCSCQSCVCTSCLFRRLLPAPSLWRLLMLPRDQFLSVSSACHMQSWDGGIWHGIASALVAPAIVVALNCFTGYLRLTSPFCTDPGTFAGLQHHVGAVMAFVLPLLLWELVLSAFVSPVVSSPCHRCLQLSCCACRFCFVLVGMLPAGNAALAIPRCLLRRLSPVDLTHHCGGRYLNIFVVRVFVSPVVSGTSLLSTPLSTSFLFVSPVHSGSCLNRGSGFHSSTPGISSH
jgi:hypothetical protein